MVVVLEEVLAVPVEGEMEGRTGMVEVEVVEMREAVGEHGSVLLWSLTWIEFSQLAEVEQYFSDLTLLCTLTTFALEQKILLELDRREDEMWPTFLFHQKY